MYGQHLTQADKIDSSDAAMLSLYTLSRHTPQSIQSFAKSFFRGTNLSALKRECDDYQMLLKDTQSRPMSKLYISAWHETISSLISREGSSNLSSSDDASRVKEFSEKFSETLIMHGILQHFWQGHYSRVLYLAESGEILQVDLPPSIFQH